MNAEIRKWRRDVQLELRVLGPKGKGMVFTDPLVWWNNNKTTFPILASVARLVRLLLIIKLSCFRCCLFLRPRRHRNVSHPRQEMS
jgi:hypothetical protein